MAKYSVRGSKGGTNVAQIIAAQCQATVRRIKLYDYLVANADTPADNVYAHQILRTTADPTGDTVTPNPLDPADAAAVGTGFDTVTGDAAGTVVLMDIPLNARASWRWVAAPGSELVAPATDNNGLAGRLSAATTATFRATMLIDE
jgi:hypothetical protein